MVATKLNKKQLGIILRLAKQYNFELVKDEYEKKDSVEYYTDSEGMTTLAFVSFDSQFETETKKVTFANFLATFLGEECTKFKVKIDDDYTADINGDGITVGCVEVSFKVFDKIKKAVKQARP